jgi:lipopolysaccharide export LptBFGC system permease protein LptF
MSFVVAAAGVSAATAIYGGIKSAKAAKDKQKLLDKQQEENSAEFNNSASKSFLDTAAAKDVVKQLDQTTEDDRKAVAGRAVVTGASDEARLAGNDSVRKNYTEGLSRIAGQGTNYQTQQKAMYLGQKNNLNNQEMGIIDDKAQNAANMASNAGSSLSGLAMSSGLNDPSKKIKANAEEVERISLRQGHIQKIINN